MGVQIYYFSGTGNCLAIAKQIARQLDDATIVSITKELLESFDNASYRQYDKCIIIYPAYAYGLPLIVDRFLRCAKFQAKYVALITSYGSKYGAALAHGKRVLEKKKVHVDFAIGIKSVENYIPIFGVMKDEKMNKRNLNQEMLTNEVIDLIKKEQKNKINVIRPLSFLINRLFWWAMPLIARFFKVSKNCDDCGLCVRLCPAKAIRRSMDGKPVFDVKKCEHCQGCLNWCPKKAITLARLKTKTRRYHHPDVEVCEFIKR